MQGRDERGLTLVEVIVAALLVATTVAVVFGAFISANQFTVPEIIRSVESNLAREKFEELYQAVRQDWWNQANQPLTPNVDPPAENITLDGVTYQRSYKVRSVPTKDYRRVEMTVEI